MKIKFACATCFFLLVAQIQAEVLVRYEFEGNSNDSSGFGLHGELVGDAEIKEGRLFLPGDFDNGFSIPLGEFNPFGGQESWTLSFDFQTQDESLGSLFSSDGSSPEDTEDFPWPGGEETGDQTGSLNVFLGEDGTVRTDFWFIDVVSSFEIYNDDETHTYTGIYDADTGEFTQLVDGEDEAIGVFEFDRDIAFDRTLIGDETNGDFGIEINPEGFHGFFDNFVIDSSGDLPEASLTGDFDLSGMLDVADVNALNEQIASGTGEVAFDLTGDGSVTEADLTFWVKDLKNSWIGDSNLDGEFNSTDFVEVFQAGKFELDIDATWAEGDWNGDKRFNSTDFVSAFQDGGFELGPRPVAESVPEPSCLVLILFGTLGLARLRK